MSGWRILASGLEFPEGPVCAPDGSVWWVEIEGGRLGRWHNRKIDRIDIGGRPNGAALGPDGALWICDQGFCAIRRFDVDTGEVATVLDSIDGLPLGKPNDLLFDEAGNLIFTCPNEARTSPDGYVCVLAADGRVKRIAEGFYFANGLALFSDGHLVVAETYRQRLIIGEWNSVDARWEEQRAWAHVGGPIGPDGMAVSSEGILYVAAFGQGHIACFDHKGEGAGVLPTPGKRPTNCAFSLGDPNILIVTEAERGELLMMDLRERRWERENSRSALPR